MVKDKSPMPSKPAAAHGAAHKSKPGILADYGMKFAENTATCGCSLRSFHGNLSSFGKPTKYKLSQIWPLFRHEFAVPAALKKLDRGANGPSSRRGFIRSPSPQNPARIKSPLFAGVSMQRDNYVEVSPRKPIDWLEEDGYDNTQYLEDECDDAIPMGTIVCTAKGSPCWTDQLHYGQQSGSDNLDDAEADKKTPDKLISNKAVGLRVGAPKRLRSTSPRSDNLYTAVEREFKRLGIYKDHNSSTPACCRDEEKGPSPSNDEAIESEVPEFSSQGEEVKDYAFSMQQPVHGMLIHDMQQCCYNFECKNHATTDDDCEPPKCNDQHSVDDQQHYGCYNDGYLNAYAPHQYEGRMQEGVRLLANARIAHNNVIESLSDALCVAHFSAVIKKAETSIQRFAHYLIKAKQRMMMREDPMQAPAHKQDITASMIRPMMPNVRFDSRHHVKYGLRACISKVIFDQFDTPSYGGEEEMGYKSNRQFVFLRAYYVLEALDNCNGEQLMEINGEFQQFCHRKLEAMKRRVGWESRWPSKLLQAFLCSLKNVWVAHKLAFAFEKPATIFFAKPRSPLDLHHMNPLMESTSSKLSPNPKHMNPLLQASFTSFNPNPNLKGVDGNKASYMMNALMETPFNMNPNPNSNPSPNFMSPNLNPNSSPTFMSPNLSPYSNPSLSPSWKFKGNGKLAGYGELKQISSRWHGLVQFTVFPGFFLKEDGVVHCIVYLQPKTPACATPPHYPNFVL